MTTLPITCSAIQFVLQPMLKINFILFVIGLNFCLFLKSERIISHKKFESRQVTYNSTTWYDLSIWKKFRNEPKLELNEHLS